MNELQKNLVKYEAFKLKGYSDGNYPNIVEKDFPEYKIYLPIVAQDYQYVIDIMYISGFGEESERKFAKWEKKNEWDIRYAKDIYNHGAGDYKTALVFVETTSRKAWVYPMHGKDEREVFVNFKRFLYGIRLRISRLLSDSGREYDMVKRYIDTLKIKIEEDGSMRYIQQIHYYQRNASQGHHTVLSRVDRFIRTLRGLMRKYYNRVEKGYWPLVVKKIVDNYKYKT